GAVKSGNFLGGRLLEPVVLGTRRASEGGEQGSRQCGNKPFHELFPGWEGRSFGGPGRRPGRWKWIYSTGKRLRGKVRSTAENPGRTGDVSRRMLRRTGDVSRRVISSPDASSLPQPRTTMSHTSWLSIAIFLVVSTLHADEPQTVRIIALGD